MKRFQMFTVFLVILLTLAACAKNVHNIPLEERGMFKKNIKIRTLPTKARIFINEQEIGTSPLKYKLTYEDNRMINIKAVPIYPNQYTQNIYLMLPPIPKTMTIYMNHFPEDYRRDKDRQYIAPEKPEPEIIVETVIDTVYIDRVERVVEILKLPSIYFDTDDFSIRPSESGKLQQLLSILKEYPALNLEILGFADNRASEAYNLKLTLNRANSVKNYLISQGIDPRRLSAIGHGRVSMETDVQISDELAESRKVLFILKTN